MEIVNKNLLDKAKTHEVKFIHSGRNHIFTVKNKKGTQYDVLISATSTSEYMGKQGIANGEIDSYIIAALHQMTKHGKIPKKSAGEWAKW